MDDGFFAGIDQVELKVDGGTALFPIFYRDARMFTVVLPANLMKLRRMLPDRRFVPLQTFPGAGGISLTAFEYYDTDIQPYNEFSIGILLNSPYFAPVPGYNVLRQYFARMFNVFIYHLPVTTELALRAGIDFYNYPKFIADIEFGDTPEAITCDLSRDGRRILSMSGAKVPGARMGEIKFMCNLYHFRQPQMAEFKLNVIDGTIRWFPSDVSWSFNTDDPIGRELADAVLGTRAAMYMYMPRIQCILYGPEHMSMPLMRHAIDCGLVPARAPAGKPAQKKSAGRRESKPPAA